MNLPPAALDVTFLLSGLTDTSGNGRVLTHTGGNAAEIGPNGAHFDGNGDYLFVDAGTTYEGDTFIDKS